jgi:general secretion pathway protein E
MLSSGMIWIMQNTRYLEPENFPKVPFVLETLSSRFIRENKIVPLEFTQNTLKIIMADPDNHEVVDALKIAISHDIEIYSSDARAIEEYIEKFYTQEIQDISKLIENIEDDSLQFIHEEEDDVGHHGLQNHEADNNAHDPANEFSSIH